VTGMYPNVELWQEKDKAPGPKSRRRRKVLGEEKRKKSPQRKIMKARQKKGGKISSQNEYPSGQQRGGNGRGGNSQMTPTKNDRKTNHRANPQHPLGGTESLEQKTSAKASKSASGEKEVWVGFSGKGNKEKKKEREKKHACYSSRL